MITIHLPVWSAAWLTLLLAAAMPCQGVEQEVSTLSEPAPTEGDEALLADDPLPEADPSGEEFLPLESEDDPLFGDLLHPGGPEDAEPEPVAEAADPAPADDKIVDHDKERGWLGNIHPYFHLGGYFDDNVFIDDRDRQADFVSVVGFGLRLGLGEVTPPLDELRTRRNVPLLYTTLPRTSGNFLFADYSGQYEFFADHSELSAYDQDALLSTGWTDGKLSLGLTARFRSLSTPDIDAGGRVRRYIFDVGTNVYYELSGKTSFESDLAYRNTQYPGLVDSSELINENWVNYQITPKIKISPGIGLGILMIHGYGEQPYGRLLIRALYEYSEKLSFHGRLGLEYRDVERGSGFRNNPIFTLGATYEPRDGTTLFLEGYRYAEASALLSGADYTVTGVEGRIRQRFLERFYLTFTAGYQNLDYHLVSDDASPGRVDNYFFGRAAVAFDITKWCNAEVFYLHQRDASTHSGNSFNSNQVGVGLDFSF
ncbi:MAG TPA: hypothetical protein VNQ90_01105 [Chthoniobacteraceae bacterium]|nr:hypothetical protein [Chthoniobacteraceae bacterium]